MKLTPLSAAVLSVLAAKSVHAESDISMFEEVVVTANQIEQPLSEVAGSVSVITSDELETQGTTELYDALRNEPGVSVTGGAGRPQNITIRGMTGNRITIIRDGIRSADGFGANDINDVVGRDSFDLIQHRIPGSGEGSKFICTWLWCTWWCSYHKVQSTK